MVLPHPMTSAPHPKWLWQSTFPPPPAQSSHSGEGTARVSLDQDEALEDEDGCVWSCCPAWGLLGCHQLPILPVGWGGRHGYLLLESREINLLLPQSGQVMFQIQERVPITSFEDWIHSLKVAHHLHRAGLPVAGSISGLQWFCSSRIVGYRWLLYCVPQGMMRQLPTHLVRCLESSLLNCKVARHTR